MQLRKKPTQVPSVPPHNSTAMIPPAMEPSSTVSVQHDQYGLTPGTEGTFAEHHDACLAKANEEEVSITEDHVRTNMLPASPPTNSIASAVQQQQSASNQPILINPSSQLPIFTTPPQPPISTIPSLSNSTTPQPQPPPTYNPQSSNININPYNVTGNTEWIYNGLSEECSALIDAYVGSCGSILVSDYEFHVQSSLLNQESTLTLIDFIYKWLLHFQCVNEAQFISYPTMDQLSSIMQQGMVTYNNFKQWIIDYGHTLFISIHPSDIVAYYDETAPFSFFDLVSSVHISLSFMLPCTKFITHLMNIINQYRTYTNREAVISEVRKCMLLLIWMCEQYCLTRTCDGRYVITREFSYTYDFFAAMLIVIIEEDHRLHYVVDDVLSVTTISNTLISIEDNNNQDSIYPINNIHGDHRHNVIQDNYNQDHNKYASLLCKFYITLFLPTERMHPNPFMKSCYVKDSEDNPN